MVDWKWPPDPGEGLVPSWLELAFLLREPTGFPNLVDSTISFDDGTLTATIAPAGTSFTYYRRGVERVHGSSVDVVITDTSGLWYIYFDESDTLVASQTYWDLLDVVPVMTVYWNSDPGIDTGIVGDERHGMVMDGMTHKYLHETVGTQWVSGLLLGGYVIDDDAEASVKVGLSNGVIVDEDLFWSIVHSAAPANPFEQILTDPAQIPVYYREGNPGYWRKDTATDYPVKNTTRVNWNEDVASTWQQTEATNDNHVAYWIMATNDPAEPVVSVQGQREDATLQDATNNNTLDALDLGDFPFAEMRALWRVVVQTGNGLTNNTRLYQIRDVADFRDVVGGQVQGQAPAHASTHENGGSDEISVAGLSGLLADPQTPLAHAAGHAEDAADEIFVENLGTGSSTSGEVAISDGTGGLDMGNLAIEDVAFTTNLRAEINALYGKGLLSKVPSWTGNLVTGLNYYDTDGGALKYAIVYSYTGSQIDSWTITRQSDSATQTFTVTYSANKVQKVVVS